MRPELVEGRIGSTSIRTHLRLRLWLSQDDGWC